MLQKRIYLPKISDMQLEKGEVTMTEFNETAMLKLVNKDHYLRFVYKDLSNRNPNMPNSEVLRVIYNSNIEGDSILSAEYNNELANL